MIHSDYKDIRLEQFMLLDMTFPEFVYVIEKRVKFGGRMPCPTFFLESRLAYYSHVALEHSKNSRWYLFRKYVILYNIIARCIRRKHSKYVELFYMDTELKRKCRRIT